MSRKMSKILVIDASVARSAGETEHPVSSACRQTLTTVLVICHRVVMCKEIAAEWRRHQSRFASSWLAAMQSKGKVVRIELPKNSTLNEKLDQLDVSENDKKAMMKDLHLIEAARQTDLRIVSSDEAARKLFRAATEHMGELSPIHWVNPTIEEDDCVGWLKSGA